MRNFITARVSIALSEPQDIGLVKDVCEKSGILLGSTPILTEIKAKGKESTYSVDFEAMTFDPSAFALLAHDFPVKFNKVKFKKLDSDIGYEGMILISKLCYRGFSL